MFSIRLFATTSISVLDTSAPSVQTSDDARQSELLVQREAIDAGLRAVDKAPPLPPNVEAAVPATAQRAASDPTASGKGDIVITAKALTLATKVKGQTDTTITDPSFRNAPATSIVDIVKLSPGVTVIGGNGPRDIGVSIWGSNDRNSFGARNIQVFEDDFPVTQPDGLARFDLIDLHAYGTVDVVCAPHPRAKATIPSKALTYRSSYFIDNANALRVLGYNLINPISIMIRHEVRASGPACHSSPRCRTSPTRPILGPPRSCRQHRRGGSPKSGLGAAGHDRLARCRPTKNRLRRRERTLLMPTSVARSGRPS